MSGGRGRRRGELRDDLRLVLLGVCLGTAACALALWVASRRPGLFPEPQWRFIVRESEPLFREERRAGGPALLVRPRGFSPVGAPQEFPLRKTAGRPRVLVAGESSADMLAHALRSLTEARRAAEIVDIGAGGAGLEMAARHLEEGLGRDPDAVVLFFANNLFFDLPGPIPYALERLCLELPLAAARCRRRQEARMSEASRLARLEGVLGRLGRWARGRGARVVVLTAPRNLLVPPRADDGEHLAPELLEAYFLRESGRRRAAVRALRAAVEARADPRPFWRFMLGLWLLEDGDGAGARRELDAAADADPERARARAAVNEAIRRAARREGLTLLDADLLLRERAESGIPGLEEFADNSHVSEANFELLAARVLELLGIFGPPRGPERARPRARTDAARLIRGPLLRPGGLRHASSAWPSWSSEWEFVLGAQAALRADPGLALEPLVEAPGLPARERARLDVLLARAFWRAGRRSEALARLERARASDPGWEEPWFWEGRFRLERGDRRGAAASLAAAVRLAPERRDAAFFLRRLSEPER